MAESTELLDRILDPVGRALSPEAARRLIALRADANAQRINGVTTDTVTPNWSIRTHPVSQ